MAARSEADRLAWVRAFERSRDAAAVCAQFGIARATLRKWWARWEAEGKAGLAERSRAPRRVPGRKVGAAEAARIAALRAEGLTLAQIRARLAESGLTLSIATLRKALAGEQPAVAAAPSPSPGLFGAVLPADGPFRALAARIAAGSIGPGAALSDARLARELGATRAAVREALRALAMVGLVELAPDRCAHVAVPSAAAVADAYAARRLLEAGSVRLLAERRDPAVIDAMRQHLRRQADAERRGDRLLLVRLLTEFHLLLAALVGNPYLQAFVGTLATTTSLAVLLLDRSAAPSCALAEHRALVRLIEAGDGDGAAALMTAHLSHNEGRLAPEG